MDNADVLMIGLAKTVIRLTVSLVAQGALDREITIRALKSYLETMEDDPVDKATAMWVRQVIEVLEADPSRPPPAQVLSLRPKDTNTS